MSNLTAFLLGIATIIAIEALVGLGVAIGMKVTAMRLMSKMPKG